MGISMSFMARPNKTSSLQVDSDLDLGAYKLKTDHIAESTGSHGIALDHTPSATTIKADHIAEKTGSHGIATDNTLTPSALSVAALTLSGALQAATVTATSYVKTPYLEEGTASAGIHVRGVMHNSTMTLTASDTNLLTVVPTGSLGPASAKTTVDGYAAFTSFTVPATHYWPAGGTMRLRLTMKAAGPGDTNVWPLKVYKNGVQQGSTWNVTGDWSTQNWDISVSPGDVISGTWYCSTVNNPTYYAYGDGSGCFARGTEANTSSFANETAGTW